MAIAPGFRLFIPIVALAIASLRRNILCSYFAYAMTIFSFFSLILVSLL